MLPIRFDKLVVKGFKTFAEASIELRSCNLIIGGNGAGKSNFLSLLRLLSSVGQGELQVYVAKAGGANEVLRRSLPRTLGLEIHLGLSTLTGKSEYRLRAERTDDDKLMIRQEGIERFDFDGNQLGGEALAHPSLESPLAAGRRPYEYQLFTALRTFHFAETVTNAMAVFEGDFADNRELREDGGNLAAYLFYLQNYHHAAYRRIIATVKQVLPEFSEFVLQPTAHNPPRIRLRWRVKGVDGDFGAHLFSDGTLRFILLTTLLTQPPDHLPKIIAIDEPELGLHPAALNLIVSLIRVASHHCQVIVATQSAALVDCFEPEDVIVVHRRQASLTLERLSSEPLQEWLSEYALGEIWEKNVLGGGPFG